MNAAAVVATSPFDTDAIRRGLGLEAEGRGLTGPEETAAREDMERAGHGSKEWNALRGIYEGIAKRSADESRALLYRQLAEAENKRQAHLAARPTRWAALNQLQRGLYEVLAQQHGEVGRALAALIPLVAEGCDTSKDAPPSTFEPERFF